MWRGLQAPSAAAVFLLLFIFGLLVYWPLLGVLPLQGDNLWVLAWVHSATLGDLLRGEPTIYPEWRPLAYLTIWLEHRLFGLSFVAGHFLINILVWTTCAWLVFLIVRHLAASSSVALLVALMLLVDQRARYTLFWIVDRQASLSCAFGLLVTYLVIRTGGRRLTRAEWASCWVTLLASALSKEYGLAFATALTVAGVAWRRWDLASAGTLAGLVYAGLRLWFASGAFAMYCEDMGFFFSLERRCVDLSVSGLTQGAYNVAAAVVGTAVQGLIETNGTIDVSPRRLAVALPFLAFAIFGYNRTSRKKQLLVLITLANAALAVLMHRHRNLIAGISSLAILVGVGLARWQPPVGDPRLRAGLRLAFLIAFAGVGIDQSLRTHRLIDELRGESLMHDPCDSSVRDYPYGDAFAQDVKEHYGMSDPTCTGGG